MTVLPSPEAMIVICTVILIAYTAHVVDKAFASSEQFEAMLSARDRIIGLQTENAKLREYVTKLEQEVIVLSSDNCDLLNDTSDMQLLVDESHKLRELVAEMRVAYIGALDECEGMDVGFIWEHCEMVDAKLAKLHARFEADRHRFDAAMRELGIEADDG